MDTVFYNKQKKFSSFYSYLSIKIIFSGLNRVKKSFKKFIFNRSWKFLPEKCMEKCCHKNKFFTGMGNRTLKTSRRNVQDPKKNNLRIIFDLKMINDPWPEQIFSVFTRDLNHFFSYDPQFELLLVWTGADQIIWSMIQYKSKLMIVKIFFSWRNFSAKNF